MSSLFSALTSAGAALDAFEQALSVSQNNVDNVSTPGYARQELSLNASPFQPLAGLPGGVSAGDLQSARDAYADESVRSQIEALGKYEQQVTSLTPVDNALDLTSQSGISAAWTSLLQSFSAWSVTPGSAALQQGVLTSAQNLAAAFQTTANTLNQAVSDSDQKLSDVVGQINNLGAQLGSYNQQVLQSTQPDAGVEANINATLEQLSNLVDISAAKQPDGTYTVLIGGQTPLVIGGQNYNLSLDHAASTNPAPANADAPEPARILDSQGQDITSQISQGELGGLLDTRNNFLPSLVGGPSQTGDLNTLAKSMADEINSLLTAGLVSSGPPAQQGVPLFTYGADTTSVAQTLAVSNSITPAQLAAIDPGPPSSSNGTALNLANLANPTSAAGEINGSSYTDFLGAMSARVGTALTTATNGQDAQTQAVAQAQTLRDQISGVSLNEEAVQVVQFQRAYQASAQMVTVLNSLTETVVNMMTLPS
jgi:flagellar hook-associated protein 1